MWLIWFLAGMVFMFCIAAAFVHKLLVRIKSNVGTPSTSHNTGSPKLPTIDEVYKAVPFPEDERECAMYVAGLADCHQYIVCRQHRAGA